MEENNTIENLKRLKQLLDDGILTEEEFTRQKRDLLHLPEGEPVPASEDAGSEKTAAEKQPKPLPMQAEGEQLPLQKTEEKADDITVSNSPAGPREGISDEPGKAGTVLSEERAGEGTPAIDPHKSTEEPEADFAAEKMRIKAKLAAEAEFQSEQDRKKKQEEEQKRLEYKEKAKKGLGMGWHIILLVLAWTASVFLFLGGIVWLTQTPAGGILAILFGIYLCPLANKLIKEKLLKGNQKLNVLIGIALFIVWIIAFS